MQTRSKLIGLAAFAAVLVLMFLSLAGVAGDAAWYGWQAGNPPAPYTFDGQRIVLR